MIIKAFSQTIYISIRNKNIMDSRGTVYIDNLKFWGYIYLDETSLIVCDVTHSEPVVSGKIKFKDIIGLNSSQKNGNIILKIDYCRYKGNSKSRIYKRIICVYPMPDKPYNSECENASETSSIKDYNVSDFINNNISNTDVDEKVSTDDTLSDISEDVPNVVTNDSSEVDNTENHIHMDMFEIEKSTGQRVAKFITDYEEGSDEEWDLIDPTAPVLNASDQEEISKAFNDDVDENADKDSGDDSNTDENITENDADSIKESLSEKDEPESIKVTNMNERIPLPYEWYDDLYYKLDLKQKKFLFIVNPVSGRGLSYVRFDTMVKPILENTKTEYSMKMTDSNPNSILNILVEYKDSLDDFTAIVGMGGDGTITDIFNSLHFLDKLDIPVGCIPTGSGNGISKCITEEHGEDFTELNCFFRIMNGDSHPLDLTVCTHGNKRTISFLSQSWGLASEVDIDSEPLRFLGNTRFTLATLWKLVRYRNYPGKLSYINMNGEEKTIDDKFIMVWACQLPWVASDMNLSPSSSFNDRVIYLFIMKEGMSRFEILNMFMGVDNGTHIHILHDKFDIVPVTSYTLTPSTDSSYVVIDGEKVPTEEISVELLPETGFIRY